MVNPRAPDDIGDHPDPCNCTRCAGLEACPMCQGIKLDGDWCFRCRRLVFINGRFRTRAELSRESTDCVAPDLSA